MSKKRTLMIMGTMEDPHVERVAESVKKRENVAVIVLDYRSDIEFMLRMTTDGRVIFTINDSEICENYLIWDRRKILTGTPLDVLGDDQVSRNYISEEWKALFTLLSGLGQERIVNTLLSKRCMIKPYQQAIAASVGFLVPPTLVTNQKSKAKKFMEECSGDMILKSLSGSSIKISDDQFMYIMTMQLKKEDISSMHHEEIAHCPHFFQKEIHKEYELRVVVAGDNIIPFKIDSQKKKTSATDWRKGIDYEDFEKCYLEHNILELIKSFMNKIGFFTGSLDLIVDREGNIWFLECNQSGAWAWLDDIVGGEITRAFDDAFSKKMDKLEASSRNSLVLNPTW